MENQPLTRMAAPSVSRWQAQSRPLAGIRLASRTAARRSKILLGFVVRCISLTFGTPTATSFVRFIGRPLPERTKPERPVKVSPLTERWAQRVRVRRSGHSAHIETDDF